LIYQIIYGGGSGPTPKKNDGPNLIQRIGNFFSNLFGGEHQSAKLSMVLPGAVVSRAWTLEVGELTSAGASYLEGLGTGVVSVGGMTLGALLMPTMIKEPEFNWTRDLPLDVPVTTTGTPQDPTLYLYRNMRSVGGLPMIGEGLDKLGLRDKDVNFLSNSTMITPLFSNGLSVTVGYGNIIPSDVPDTHKKQTLFRISASSLVSYGLIGMPVPNNSNPFYGQIRPATPMNVGTFRTLIQSTAPAWQPVK
jgi:hypothetical protein